MEDHRGAAVSAPIAKNVTVHETGGRERKPPPAPMVGAPVTQARRQGRAKEGHVAIRALSDLLDSRPWIVLSICCSLYALYEGVARILAGDTIEGVLDLILMIVFIVNFVNRFKALARYAEKLVN